MSGTKINPTNAATFTFGGKTVTVLNQYYLNGEAYMDVKYPDGSIQRRIPADNSAANPPKTNAKDGQHTII